MEPVGFNQFLCHIGSLYNVTIYVDNYPDWMKSKILIKDNDSKINTSITIKMPVIWENRAVYERIEEAAKMVAKIREMKHDELQ